jgi:transposase
MATVQSYTSRGYTYYRLVTSKRGPDGKPRLVVLRHLGTAQDLAAHLTQSAAPPKEGLVAEFGGCAALMSVARELGFASIIDRHAPKRGQGPSVGEYILLAAINRVMAPRSKRGFHEWYRSTALLRLLGIPERALSSQRFWDHMGYLTEKRLEAIQEDLVGALVEKYDIDLRALFYDGTNFDTYLDSETICELAKRGHAKSKRTDLRIVSMGLLVSPEFHLPLLWDVYPGNRPDSVELRTLIDTLVERYKLFARHCEDVTVVFDKGNNAKDNLLELADSPYHIVGSFVPSHHKDLLAVAASKFTASQDPRLEGVTAYRTQKEVYGRSWTIVVTRSDALLRGQLRGIEQHLNKRRAQLRKLQTSLARWYRNNKKGKGYTFESLQARIRKIVAGGQFVSQILNYEVRQRRGRLTFSFETDRVALARLAREVLGKRILFTDQESWTTDEIILAYRGQHHVERAFRDMKHPVFVSFRPAFHRTDDKLRVHAFYCIAALLLASLLHRKVVRAGFPVSLQRLLALLSDIKEVYTFAPTAADTDKGKRRPGRRRTDIIYSRLNDEQRRLVEILELHRWQATPHIQRRA